MTAYEFPLSTGVIPQDHGYVLFSALCRAVPSLHGRHDIQVAPVRGTRIQNGDKLKLDRGSRLHIRGITAEEALRLQTAGFLEVLGSVIFVGQCHLRSLVPSSRLVSRHVILPDAVSEPEFLTALGGLLPEGVEVEVGRTRALAYKGRKYLGHSVVLQGLSPEDSLRIQERGLGKFTSQGCGVFYPGTPRGTRRHQQAA